jgi:YidC/Oxa1 family membrane protein insertase
MPFVSANVLQPLIDVFEEVLLFFHDTIGASWGPLDHPADRHGAGDPAAPDLQAVPVDGGAPEARAGDEGAAGEVQGRPPAPQPGDDEVLPGEQGQSPGLPCLPLLAQMPVFIALFYMLRADLKVDICDADEAIAPGGPFEGRDLSDITCDEIARARPPSVHPDLTAAATAAILAILIVLYIGSQLLSSVMMSTTVDKNQRGS